MGRIIKTGNASKDRLWLEKAIVVSIRELAKQSSVDQSTNDLVAFIALSLFKIGESVEESVLAWEKRGYWVKADRYRMEWSWSAKLGEDLVQALIVGDWEKVVSNIALISQKLSNVNVPEKNRMGKPWIGSWNLLISPKDSH